MPRKSPKEHPTNKSFVIRICMFFICKNGFRNNSHRGDWRNGSISTACGRGLPLTHSRILPDTPSLFTLPEKSSEISDTGAEQQNFYAIVSQYFFGPFSSPAFHTCLNAASICLLLTSTFQTGLTTPATPSRIAFVHLSSLMEVAM